MNNLLRYEKYLYIFLLVGVVVYFPIFFNGFVWDDLAFIINNPEVHQLNFLKLFGPTLFNSGPFYRPIPAIYFATIYTLFSQQAFFYHVLQLVLHLADTYLLFLFLYLFFNKGISFFLALLFLVHPINVESVAYIGSTQSELYFLPGIIALLLASEKNLSRHRLFVIIGLLLLCALTKETGFLFFLLLLIYRYIFKLNKLKEFLLSGGFIVLVYALLRIFIGGVVFHESEIIPIATLSLSQRIFNIPAIFIYYIKTFFFPLHLVIWQTWIIKFLTYQNFIIPLFLCLFFFSIIVYSTIILYKQEEKQQKNKPREIRKLLFFSAWFVIGVSIILQVIPLDMTVADRWFYFPIVGLLGMIGVGMQKFQGIYMRHSKFYYWGAVIILCLFSFRTFVRTFDWKDNLTLYAHDTQENSDNYILDHTYGSELMRVGKYDQALPYIQKSLSIKSIPQHIVSLGIIYQQQKKYNEAIAIFTSLLKQNDPQMEKTAYFMLAATFTNAGHPVDAIKLINEQALKKYSQDAVLYLVLAVAESHIQNHQKALEAISQAYKLSPNEVYRNYYDRIKNNLPLKEITIE